MKTWKRRRGLSSKALPRIFFAAPSNAAGVHSTEHHGSLFAFSNFAVKVVPLVNSMPLRSPCGNTSEITPGSIIRSDNQ